MSTKALRKELFAAVAMLIVAAIALSGSTYAWFAANTTVTADNMNVTVASDTTFLLIGQGNMSVEAVKSASVTITEAAITTAAVMPAAHENAITSTTAIDDIETNSEWYYTYSDDPAKSTSGSLTHNPLTTVAAFANPGGYVLVNEFSLTVADGSNGIQNLKVSDCSITSTSDAAVKVIVATDEGAEEFAASAAGGVTTVAGENTIAASITSGAVKLVKVYVYWDGNDADVFTNNIANLLGTKVVIRFTGTAAPN